MKSGTSRAKELADLLGGGFLMAQAVTQTTPLKTVNPQAAVIPPPAPNREKALQILSKSIYKELRENGYEPKQIVSLATEIISLVTTDLDLD
jgi:hypothetical protein